MKIISSIVCRISGYHKYSYYTDRCVRCGKVRRTNSTPQELHTHRS